MNLTKREKDLLKQSIDMSISAIGGSIGKVKPEERTEVRKMISDFLNLSNKIDSLPEEKEAKDE